MQLNDFDAAHKLALVGVSLLQHVTRASNCGSSLPFPDKNKKNKSSKFSHNRTSTTRNNLLPPNKEREEREEKKETALRGGDESFTVLITQKHIAVQTFFNVT